jgi:DNA-binding transcriptional LysR family regulator
MLLETEIGEPLRPLREGRIDVLAIHLPVREHDLTVGPVILREQQLLGVPANHPLASRATASLEDLADYPVVSASAHGYWLEHFLPERTPSGRPITPVAHVDTIQAGIALVAAGKGIGTMIEQNARYHAHPRIVFIPLIDAPVAEVALVWTTDRATETIRAFARLAAEYG